MPPPPNPQLTHISMPGPASHHLPPLRISCQDGLGYQQSHLSYDALRQKLREYARTGAKDEVVTVKARLATLVEGRVKEKILGISNLMAFAQWVETHR